MSAIYFLRRRWSMPHDVIFFIFFRRYLLLECWNHYDMTLVFDKKLNKPGKTLVVGFIPHKKLNHKLVYWSKSIRHKNINFWGQATLDQDLQPRDFDPSQMWIFLMITFFAQSFTNSQCICLKIQNIFHNASDLFHWKTVYLYMHFQYKWVT